MKASDADKQAKIELQKKIQAAVVSGSGWERHSGRTCASRPTRRGSEASSPTIRPRWSAGPSNRYSIVQGDLDTQVPPAKADRLAELGRARKKAGPVEEVHIPGINHLLVPATTGEVSEYASLKDHTVSPKVADVIVEWVKKSF